MVRVLESSAIVLTVDRGHNQSEKSQFKGSVCFSSGMGPGVDTNKKKKE
jgi:hypothetical protein